MCSLALIAIDEINIMKRTIALLSHKFVLLSKLSGDFATIAEEAVNGEEETRS